MAELRTAKLGKKRLLIQMAKARERKLKWGDKPCNHKTLSKEYCLGADTGDYACTTCGLAMPMGEWKKLRKQQHGDEPADDDSE